MTNIIKDTVILDLALLDIDDAKNPRKTHGLNEETLEEFAVRMQAEGQITPVLVRETPGGRYELVAGYRRVKAAGIIGWRSIRAEVLDPSVSDVQAMFFAQLENLDREPLSDYDYAIAALELTTSQQMTLQAYADRVGRDYDKLQKMIGWLRTLPPPIVEAWRDGDSRARSSVLGRLAAMAHEDALAEWETLKDTRVVTVKKDAHKRGGLRRPGRRQLEALMERLHSSGLAGQTRSLVLETIEYVQGARRNPPYFPKAVTKASSKAPSKSPTKPVAKSKKGSAHASHERTGR